MFVNDAPSKHDVIIFAEVEGCLDIAKEAILLLNNLSTPQYNQIAEPFLQSSIGQHMRHILDVFHATMSWPNNEIIDYDTRRRTHLVEKDKALAIDEWLHISEWLKGIEYEQLSKKLKVKHEISANRKISALSHSTFARELSFISSHAVHHFALIRVSLSFQGISPSDTFGMAPSTATYYRRAE